MCWPSGLKAGAKGYLLKDVEPSMLIKAIHVVNEGNAFVYPKLAERIFGSNLYATDFGSHVEEYFAQMLQGPGAVRRTLQKYLA